MRRLSDKVAVITGGNSGIGLVTAQRFVEEGARVVITGRRQEALDDALKTLGDRAVAIQGDISSAEDRKRLFADVKSAYGRLDILFLNAGIAKFEPIEGATEAVFDETIAVNLKGPYFAVQEALPLLGPGATIILNTSAANAQGLPSTTAYAASKAALRSLARTLAAELAPKGIRVNAVSPGPIETPIYGKMDMPKEAVDAFAQSIQTQVPMGRFGSSDEVAGAVAFLASSDSGYVTGSELVVDGGMSQV